jgi:putative methionine-R-sulfoxide reductase with GAF domain
MAAGGQVREPDELRTRELTLMTGVIDAALEHPGLGDLLDELLKLIADILAADTAAFLLLDRSTDELVARAAKGIEEEVEQGVRIPVGRGFAGRIAAERSPVTIEDVDHAEILNPILRQKGIRSLLGVPLLVDGEVIGVLHVGTLVPRIFSETDRRLLAARRRPCRARDRPRPPLRAAAGRGGDAARTAARRRSRDTGGRDRRALPPRRRRPDHRR